MTAPANPAGLRVCIIDDDPLILELHRLYVERMSGFTVAFEAHSTRMARQFLVAAHNASPVGPTGLTPDPVDLILLDITMQDDTGLNLLRQLRAHGIRTPVIIISGVRDSEQVHEALALGVSQYLMKPFTYAAFAERMQQFLAFRQLTPESHTTTQQDVDALFSASRPLPSPQLPKGLSADTLRAVTSELRSGVRFTAQEMADAVGLSRVGARRYLEFLSVTGSAHRYSRHGGTGRPQTEYLWL